MSLRRPKLGVRARLLLAVVAAVAVALAAIIGGFNLLLAQRLSANATALARERAVARISTLRIVDGHVARAEGPDDAAGDTQIWIYDGTRAIEQTVVREEIASAARALGVSGHGTTDVPGAETRLVAVPVVRNGHRLGAVVAGVSLAPYEETRNTALLGSTALGVGLLLAVALAARWMLAAALRPVARMTADADAWSERGVNRRFAVGEPHDELTRLAATLDALLDRVAASLRHEQRFTAELSHELRTPVAKISAEAELALRRARTADEYVAALDVVKRNAEQMTRTVETLVAAAREEAGLARSTADAGDAVAGTIANCSPLAGERGIAIEFAAPRAPLRVGVDGDLVERILQPLLENACNYGRSRVRVSVERNGSGVLLTLEDDGPGVAAEERERIFEPGVRGSAASPDADVSGAGLGLALSRRLARAAGGEVSLGRAERGARFLVQLPAA